MDLIIASDWSKQCFEVWQPRLPCHTLIKTRPCFAPPLLLCDKYGRVFGISVSLAVIIFFALTQKKHQEEERGRKNPYAMNKDQTPKWRVGIIWFGDILYFRREEAQFSKVNFENSYLPFECHPSVHVFRRNRTAALICSGRHWRRAHETPFLNNCSRQCLKTLAL